MFTYEHIQAETDEAFVQRSTEFLEQGIIDAIAKRGQCILGLSGGSTPGPVYMALGRSKEIDWSKVSLFLIDERYVPKDHKESNQRFIRETLLAHANVPRSNLTFPNTSLGVGTCVTDYEDRLRALLAEGPPDILVLGMGEDGHIASLFPGDGASLEERRRMVLHSMQNGFAIQDRITVTIPLLASARSMLFLLKNKGKQKIFEEIMKAPFAPVRYPAHVLLQTGKTVWMTYW